MYYESVKTSIEEEFKYNNLDEELKFKAFDLLNRLSEDFDKLASSKANVLAAAIAFFVLAQENQIRNFKQMEDDFGVDAKKLAMKAKEIGPFLGIENYSEFISEGLLLSQEAKQKKIREKPERIIPNQILKTARTKSDNSVEINDEDFIDLTKEFKKFSAYLFKHKDYIEIKQFIKLLELNLFMAGYETTSTDIEKKFGDLFIHLGFEPKKGREQEKFVNLRDRFGNSEPFSLIKLGE